ncbi:hypothetical protein [Thalassotalea sp. ND16A]|uniref:hypothetical protein n=1 Tax=Thalassotalea sp. ND16A TaxID=1535422 RepID=UPI00051A6CC0|nr:hypothetical protein [Thalassotalea sp. ND16A]KGK00096.1 hypothetical protein ND16A_0287 [Thalassotalea sp. ND16A]
MKIKHLSSANETGQLKQETRRNFIKKYGKLAIVTPVAVTTLMAPKTSKAMNSDTGPGDII